MLEVATSEGTPIRLLEPAGKGSMGVVWRGRYAGDPTPLAVKVLSKLWDQPEMRTTFLTEVHSQAELRHPGVVQIYGYGQLEREFTVPDVQKSPKGTPYMTLEWTNLGTLRDLSGPSRWADLKGLLLQVLDALAYAHARGVVHCDLKPENILLFDEGKGRGRFKLADFGVAHALERTAPRQTGDVANPDAGTPSYMAPEQLRSEWRTFGGWTDLYALGCVAYECAAGHRPFESDELLDIARGHLEEPRPTLEPQFPVPEAFHEWLEVMLARDFQDRFRWAASAAWALHQMDPPEGEEPTENASEIDKAAYASSLGGIGSTGPSSQMGTLADTEEIISTRPLHGEDDEEIPAMRERPEAESTSHSFNPPPLPTHWGRPEQLRPEIPSEHVQRLFELREIPFVGRRDERDAIWEAFGEVVVERTPRAVIIEGPEGSGKTRLAAWMGQRARELGLATYLEAQLEPGVSGDEELTNVLRSWFRTWGLDRDSSTDMIRSKLISIAPDETPSAQIDQLAEWLAESLFGDDALHEAMYDDRESRLQFHTRILRMAELECPLYVVQDDAQWSADALAFAERMVDEEISTPVLFVATYNPEAESEGEPPPQLAELRANEHTRELVLEPLRPEARDELIRRATGVDPERVYREIDDPAPFPGELIDQIRDALFDDSSGGG